MELRGNLYLTLLCLVQMIVGILNGVYAQPPQACLGGVIFQGECIPCTSLFCANHPDQCQGCQDLTLVILYCESNPCQHGNCTEGADRPICFCPTEWTGANCETQVKDLVILYCESNPCQHGNCTEGADRYICSCPNEWTGANCETQVKDANGGSSPQMISSRSYFTVLMGAILALLMVMEMY